MGLRPVVSAAQKRQRLCCQQQLCHHPGFALRKAQVRTYLYTTTAKRVVVRQTMVRVVSTASQRRTSPRHETGYTESRAAFVTIPKLKRRCVPESHADTWPRS